MKKVIGIMLLLIIIITPCLAAKKSLQGDFQVFKLGDKRKKVIRKMKEYVKQGKVEFVPGEGNRITLVKDHEIVYFCYFKNKLYMITIQYPEGYKGLPNRKEIVSSLKGILVETYEQPMEEKDIPDKTEPMQSYNCASWVLAQKNIDLLIRTDILNIASVMIDIYNPLIRAQADPETVKDFGPPEPVQEETTDEEGVDQNTEQL